jgi:cobalamin biosynthesis Mg chelatase CobN
MKRSILLAGVLVLALAGAGLADENPVTTHDSMHNRDQGTMSPPSNSAYGSQSSETGSSGTNPYSSNAANPNGNANTNTNTGTATSTNTNMNTTTNTSTSANTNKGITSNSGTSTSTSSQASGAVSSTSGTSSGTSSSSSVNQGLQKNSPARSRKMPMTASPIPMIGLAGLLALGAGLGLRVLRHE